MVELPAHDGFVVGSIPAGPKISFFFMNFITGCKYIGAGLATVGLVGAGVGIGVIFGAFLTAYSRNPQLKEELFRYAVLAFALTEAIALFALMMAFLILYS